MPGMSSINKSARSAGPHMPYQSRASLSSEPVQFAGAVRGGSRRGSVTARGAYLISFLGERRRQSCLERLL